MERKKLGKYCGPFFNDGDAMSAKMLTSKATSLKRVIAHTVDLYQACTCVMCHNPP